MNITAYHLAAYGAGLAMTLVLASYLTPRAWWRRPTVRNAAILMGGTWALGALLLNAFVTPVSANALASAAPVKLQAALPAPSQPRPPAPAAGQPFRVHRDLNLRADASTGSARLATVPAGAVVTPTGERRGDWWQIHVQTRGRVLTGWASSLWLRNKGE